MQMTDMFTWCLDHWAFTAFLITCVIQITPIIRLNPLSALLSWIGHLLTADVSREVAAVKAALERQQTMIDENEKDRIRYEVLDFANSCRNGRKHTKDEFEHIIVLNQKYHGLLKRTSDENGVFTAEYAYIYELYQKCQRENSFL